MSKIRPEDHNLLVPGVRVRIMPKLMGAELYGSDDPDECAVWLGEEVTIRDVSPMYDNAWIASIEEDHGVSFFMEEIECIIEDTEICESDEPLSVLMGGIM